MRVSSFFPDRRDFYFEFDTYSASNNIRVDFRDITRPSNASTRAITPVGCAGEIRMKRGCIGFTFVWSMLLLVCGMAFADAGQDWADREFLSGVTAHIFCERYDSAYRLCDRFIRAHPDEPAGYFFRAYALMAEMTEERDNRNEVRFFDDLDSVKALAARRLDTLHVDRNAWPNCFIGNAWAYESLWHARFGSSKKAYKVGSKASSYYEAALKCDSMMYDAYAGLGAFHYWKSAKAGLLRTFRIIKDERKKGIAELNLAAESSLISRETARKTLITILIDHHQYDSAISIAQEMLAAYPGGRSFLWGLSRAHYYKADISNAAMYYAQLRETVSERPGNYANLVECDAQITRCYENLGDTDQALECAAHFTEYSDKISEDVREDQKQNIKYLLEVLKR